MSTTHEFYDSLAEQNCVLAKSCLAKAESNYALACECAKLAKENERIAKMTFIISAIFIIPLVIVACVLCCVKGSGKGRLSTQPKPTLQEQYLEPSKNTPTADCGYNTDIAIGHFPIKTGYESNANAIIALTPNLDLVDLVLSENITPNGILSIASVLRNTRKGERRGHYDNT